MGRPLRDSTTSSSDKDLRTHPSALTSAKEDATERALTDEEAKQLLEWLHAGVQQKLEREWLMAEWREKWKPAGPGPDEIENLIGWLSAPG